MGRWSYPISPGAQWRPLQKESNLSLMEVTERLGLRLLEVDDWNCCGSSSAHSLNQDLAFHLATRNLSLASPDRPLIVMCPSCLHRLQLAHKRIKEHAEVAGSGGEPLGAAAHPELKIFHFFEVLSGIDRSRFRRSDCPKAQRPQVRSLLWMYAGPSACSSKGEKLPSAHGKDPFGFWGPSHALGLFSSLFAALFWPQRGLTLPHRWSTRSSKGLTRQAQNALSRPVPCASSTWKSRCSLDSKIPVLHLPRSSRWP